MTGPPLQPHRTQTGVRICTPLLKTLAAPAEYTGMSLGGLLEGIVLHGFENKPALSDETLAVISQLKAIYGRDRTRADSHLKPESEENEE